MRRSVRGRPDGRANAKAEEGTSARERSIPTGSKTPKSERDSWRTPQWLFDVLNERSGGYEVDLAADDSNHKCAEYLTIRDDALTVDWSRWRRAWCNPPYSDIGPWLRRAAEYRETTSTTLLVPAPNGESCYRLVEEFRGHLYLIHGRIAFERPDGTPVAGNTRGSCVIVFGRLPGRMGWLDRDALRAQWRAGGSSSTSADLARDRR